MWDALGWGGPPSGIVAPAREGKAERRKVARAEGGRPGAAGDVPRVRDNIRPPLEHVQPDFRGCAVCATVVGCVCACSMPSPSPFGEVENASPHGDDQIGFTGHIRDHATGLTYMQARYYSPVAGRMLGVDPVDFASDGRPGMVNRYSYALNDPINLLDPDGRQSSTYRNSGGCSGYSQGCTGVRNPDGTYSFHPQHQLSTQTIEQMSAVTHALSYAMSLGSRVLGTVRISGTKLASESAAVGRQAGRAATDISNSARLSTIPNAPASNMASYFTIKGTGSVQTLQPSGQLRGSTYSYGVGSPSSGVSAPSSANTGIPGLTSDPSLPLTGIGGAAALAAAACELAECIDRQRDPSYYD